MRVIIIALFVFFLNTLSFAQSYNINRPQMVSPEAASLGKYIETPVSLYTGLPQISIPIYEVPGNDLKLPISLSYNASGIKVEEMASQVGLGWSLNAGGVITRIIRGKEDLNLSNFTTVNNYIAQDPGTMSYCTQRATTTARTNFLMGSEQADFEQDIFYFSFGAYSGKFARFPDGKYRTIPLQDMKIEQEYITGSLDERFTLTTPDGAKYIFGVSRDKSLRAIERNQTIDEQGAGGASNNSAMYLVEVITPNRNQIRLSYATANTQFTAGWQQLREQPYPSNGNLGTVLPDKWFRTIVGGVRLQTITFDNGKVDFEGGLDRCDLSGGKALTKIIISAKVPGGTYVERKHYNLYYSYFTPTGPIRTDQAICNTDAEINYRLKLDSLAEFSAGGVRLPPYIFRYNTINLPGRSSTSTDHWGYYNGAANFTKRIPKMYILQSTSSSFSEVWDNTGADRNVNPLMSKAGTLEEMQYPTGGKTVFEMEPNTFTSNVYSAYFGDQMYQLNPTQQPVQTGVNANLMNNAPVGDDVNFDINYPTSQNVQLKLSCNPANSPYGPDCLCECFRFVLDGLSSGVTNVHQVIDITPNVNGSFGMLTLQPGSYRMRIERKNGFTGNDGSNCATVALQARIVVQFSYFTIPPAPAPAVYNVATAGLRVKSVSQRSDNTVLIKKYNYNTPGDTLSSGTYNSRPIYWYTLTGFGSGYDVNSKLIYSSNSTYPLSATSGSYIGYKYVTVTEDDNATTGKTEYRYTTGAEFPDTLYGGMVCAGFLESAIVEELHMSAYPPACDVDWRRGLLLEEKKYRRTTSGFELVSSITNQYKFTGNPATDSLKRNAMGIKYSEYGYLADGGVTHSKMYLLNFYNTTTEFLYLSSRQEQLFDGTGNALTSTTNYFYDYGNILQPSREKRLNSKGENYITRFYYPPNKTVIAQTVALDAGTSVAIDSMNARFVIAGRLMTERYQNANLLERTFAAYKLWNADKSLLAPATVFNQTVGIPLESRAQFNQYATNGNIQEQQKTNDVKEVYLWGYNGCYPVAKIIGSDYATVNQVISQAQIDNASGTDQSLRTLLHTLRTDNRTQNALVTTYTYAPLIGITSETDPAGRTTFYEYDGFGRLVLVRNHEGYILKKICYNLYGQPVGCD